MQVLFNKIISSYPHALAIILGGSYMKGTFDHYSDYDFTIITMGNEHKFSSQMINGRKIDLCYWGIDNLKSKISHLDFLNPHDQELAFIISKAKILTGEELILSLKNHLSEFGNDELRKIGIKIFSIINTSKLEIYLDRKNVHDYMLEICELNKWMTIYHCNLKKQFYSGSPVTMHPELKKVQNINHTSSALIKKSLFKLRNEICTSLNTLLSKTFNSEAPKSKMPKPYLISSNLIDTAWSRPFTGFIA